MIRCGSISMPLVCFLSILFVYTLSINVLDVSQILVGSVIFGAKPDEMTLSKNNIIVIIGTQLQEVYIEVATQVDKF